MLEAIILVGGQGTRLRSVLPDIPKSMALINGKPFLEILLTRLRSIGFKRVILSVGYLADHIKNYFGNDFMGMSLEYSPEEKPLGTGGALMLASKLVKNSYFIVYNGDSFIDFNLTDFFNKWLETKKVLILSTCVNDVSRYGVIIEKDNKVTSFGEKKNKGSGYINAGVYIFCKSLLRNYSNTEVFSLEKDIFENEAKKGNVYCFKTKSKFIDIGVPDDLKAADLFFKDR